MKSKCQGKNKNGTPCRNYTIGDTQYCRQHIPLELINKETNKSIKIPNTVFWFIVGALGEAVVSDVFDYIKYSLGYEFIIPPIKSSDDNPPPDSSTFVVPTISATHSPLEAVTPTPTLPPIHQSTHTPTSTLTDGHHPNHDNNLQFHDPSLLHPNLHNESMDIPKIHLDIPDDLTPPLTPLIGVQETSTDNRETKFNPVINIGGTTVVSSSVLPPATPIPDGIYIPPFSPPLGDTDDLSSDGNSDNDAKNIYVDEQALVPLQSMIRKDAVTSISASYSNNAPDTLGEMLFMVFAFSAIALFAYLISIGVRQKL